MQIAIPKWRERVSPVFDSALSVILLRVEDGREQERTQTSLGGRSPLGKVRHLLELGVDVLICGAISRPVAAMCLASRIEVIPWVTGPIHSVVQTFLDGKLPDPAYTMPGCCGQRRRNRCRRGPGANRKRTKDQPKE